MDYLEEVASTFYRLDLVWGSNPEYAFDNPFSLKGKCILCCNYVMVILSVWECSYVLKISWKLQEVNIFVINVRLLVIFDWFLKYLTVPIFFIIRLSQWQQVQPDFCRS